MGNLFSKKNKDVKLIGVDVNIKPVNSNERSIVPNNKFGNYFKTPQDDGKFIPDDELYRRYNEFTLKVRDIHSNEQKIKNNLEKIERYEEQLKEDTNGDIQKIVQKHETSIEIEKLKSQNKNLEIRIKQAKESDLTVMNEWSDYCSKIQKIIDDNNFTGEMTITNLYCSTNLYTYITLKVNDTIYVNKADETYQLLAKISQVVNIRHMLEQQKINKDKLTIALNNYVAITNVMQPTQKQYEQVLDYMPKEDPNHIKLDQANVNNAITNIVAANEQNLLVNNEQINMPINTDTKLI